MKKEKEPLYQAICRLIVEGRKCQNRRDQPGAAVKAGRKPNEEVAKKQGLDEIVKSYV